MVDTAGEALQQISELATVTDAFIADARDDVADYHWQYAALAESDEPALAGSDFPVYFDQVVNRPNIGYGPGENPEHTRFRERAAVLADLYVGAVASGDEELARQAHTLHAQVYGQTSERAAGLPNHGLFELLQPLREACRSEQRSAGWINADH